MVIIANIDIVLWIRIVNFASESKIDTMKKIKIISAAIISIAFASCAVIRPGEVGVK